MTKQEKRYKRKKQQIMKILQDMVITHDSDEEWFQISPMSWDCEETCEKILSKFGVNKSEKI